jgi:hypothetical protein
MKIRIQATIVAALLSAAFTTQAPAQGTTVSYQGVLNQSGSEFTGNAEFQATLWDASSGGSQVAANSPASVIVPVNGGLFVLPLNFGEAPFAGGSERWLQLEVRTTIGSFTTLSPRQRLTPTPYAIRAASAATAATAAVASSVDAANITGTLLLTQLPSTVVTNTQSGVNLTGSFTGGGDGLTNLNANTLVMTTTNVSISGWGNNAAGQRSIPSGMDEPTAVSPGAAHSLVLQRNGTVAAWGDNTYGQTNIPAGLGAVSAIAAGYAHNLVLRSNGSVVAWGWHEFGQTNVPGGLGTVSAVSGGLYHSAALRTDGTVAVWGTNLHGQLNVPGGLNNVTAISAGLVHTLALRANGTVVAWGGGDSDYGQSTIPAGLSNVVAITAGGVHSLALKTDGTVVAWGGGHTNDPAGGVHFGQSIVPEDLSNVIAVAAGLVHSLALKADGTVVAWGGNVFGQASVPPGLNNVVALGSGSAAHHSLVLRKRSQAPVAWLDSDNSFNGNIEINGDAGVFGDLRLNDGTLWLRRGGDRHHGIGWYDSAGNKPFGDFGSEGGPDGPVLFGFAGGALGTTTNGNRVALVWDAKQRVGIGTTTPGALLSLGGETAASKLLVYESFGSRAGLGYTNSQFRLHLPGPSSFFNFLDAPTGTSLLSIWAFNGFVGIGTGENLPGAKLEVRGNIRLGSSGQFFAPGGTENLRIVRGVVGATGNILAGEGFTVAKGVTGFFTLTFSPSFAGTPAVVATPQSGIGRIATCTSVSSSSSGIWTRDSAGTAVDNQFNFIAIGPR